jgi:hypothetical protein
MNDDAGNGILEEAKFDVLQESLIAIERSGLRFNGPRRTAVLPMAGKYELLRLHVLLLNGRRVPEEQRGAAKEED